MHFHLEIIMPPTDDVEAAVAKIMAPFNERDESEDADRRAQFWDWYVIGGRWSGTKDEIRFDKEKLEAFNAALQERKVTVSGVRFGKPTLQPATQIPIVDALWREFFPETTGPCPMFDHSPKTVSGDVCTLAELHPSLEAERVILAGIKHNDELGAVHMAQRDFWNGVNYCKSTWDGNVNSSLSAFRESLANYRKEYADSITPQDDWLVVTIDYHS